MNTVRGMEDWEVAVEVIVAAVLWLVGLALVVVDLWTGVDLGNLGLFVAGIGAVLTLRRSHLSIRAIQKDAFEVGRDFERGQMRQAASVHALR